MPTTTVFSVGVLRLFSTLCFHHVLRWVILLYYILHNANCWLMYYIYGRYISIHITFYTWYVPWSKNTELLSVSISKCFSYAQKLNKAIERLPSKSFIMLSHRFSIHFKLPKVTTMFAIARNCGFVAKYGCHGYHRISVVYIVVALHAYTIRAPVLLLLDYGNCRVCETLCSSQHLWTTEHWPLLFLR